LNAFRLDFMIHFRCRSTLRLVPVALVALAWAWFASAEQPAAKKEAAASFDQQAKPFVTKYCVSCHGGAKPAGDFSLVKADGNSIQDDRPSWEGVRDRITAGEMPPKKKQPQPSMEEKKAFLAWLDGALQQSACTTPADPGRVTLRRLNRVEYNNTIRDLLGIDIQPADDFPADDIGYGFDNIGDVLAVSPLLFEKYLSAAERIIDKAFADELIPLPPTSIYTGIVLKESVKGKGGYDWVAASKQLNFKAGAWAYTEGELYIDHEFKGDGDYKFHYAAFGAQTDKDPVKVAMLLDGKVISENELKPFVADRRPGGKNFNLDVKGGTHRISVRILNPKTNADEKDEKKKTRAVVFDNLSIRGPIPAVEYKPSESYKRIMTVKPGKDVSDAEAACRILEPFARRAFRRPVTKAEIDRLVKLVQLARGHGDSFDKGIQLALQAVLVSPHFLFKVEHERPLLDKPYPISEHELATRLSYFLWSTMPDEELSRLADKGELRNNLEPQVRRMLKDPKVSALGENFAGQWLQVRNVQSIMIDPALFPAFTDELRMAMARETTMFFEAIVKEDRPILDFIDGDFTFVNEKLAKHYGIPGVKGSEFRRVSLKGTPRGGILTQGSVLTVTSNATRTSPVKRGKFILENLLNAPPPPPPPMVPELKDVADADATGPLRKRMEQHRANPDCAVCHDKMDALGFAFENFDAIGAWRTKDGKYPIDPAGTLPDGRSFRDPAELRALLRSEPGKFRRCLAEKLLTYALGRGIEPSDHCSVDAVGKSAADNGDTFAALILAVVKSDPFQLRSANSRGAKK
jgi:hypothetical protein